MSLRDRYGRRADRLDTAPPMTTPTPDEICERLRNGGHCREAADLIQQQQATIERLSAEKVALEREIAPLRKLRDDPAWEELRAALGKDASDE